MSNLEDRVAQVFNASVRPLASEVLQCHLKGAQRGCIVLTWAAACADLIEKTFLLQRRASLVDPPIPARALRAIEFDGGSGGCVAADGVIAMRW